MNKTADLALRNLRTHVQAPSWVLGRAALAASLLTALSFGAAGSGRVGAAGLNVFRGLLWIDFAFVTMVAIGPFASALAEEREGETLAVLRLAGLQPLAIVASKALGLFGSTLLLLAVQVPFAVLATALGGVSVRQVATAFVTLAAYTIGAQGVALCMAARATGAKQAGSRTAWTLGLWLLAPQILGVLASWLVAVGAARGVGSGPLADWIDLAHLASPLTAALPKTGQPAPQLFSPFTWIALVVGLVGFGLAVNGIAREETPREPRRARWHRPRVHGTRSAALVWKEENFLLGGKPAQQRRAIAYVVLFLSIGLFTFDLRGGWISTWSHACFVAFATIAYVEASVAASHLYRDELRERTLFGLALLPIPPITWATAKVRGAMRAMRGPLIAAGVALVMGQLSGNPGVIWLALTVFPAIVSLNLTLFLSLWLPRGSFIVAAVLTALPLTMVASAGRARDVMACGLFYVGGPLAIAFVGWLQARIGHRLRQLATQY
ncbi:MAG: hypothetical protein R3F56_23155 [Planctomycetota bacterium]